MGCSHVSPKPEAGCLKEAPPKLEEVYSHPDCPPDFAVCLDHENAVNLIKDVEVLKDYAIKAWFLCGDPAPEKKPTNESQTPPGSDVPL